MRIVYAKTPLRLVRGAFLSVYAIVSVAVFGYVTSESACRNVERDAPNGRIVDFTVAQFGDRIGCAFKTVVVSVAANRSMHSRMGRNACLVAV